MEYFVYIIKSRSANTYYTGFTNNLERRLKEHNQHNRNSKTTYKLNDYSLVFCQIVDTGIDARILERFLKSGAGREFRNAIIVK